MNEDVKQMLIVVFWTAAAGLLIADGLLDVLQYPSTTLLDGGEIVVGVALSILLVIWVGRNIGNNILAE
jgi:hypothetical protein